MGCGSPTGVVKKIATQGKFSEILRNFVPQGVPPQRKTNLRTDKRNCIGLGSRALSAGGVPTVYGTQRRADKPVPNSKEWPIYHPARCGCLRSVPFCPILNSDWCPNLMYVARQIRF